MKRSQFTDEQIIGLCETGLKHEPATGPRVIPNGVKTADLCRKDGMSETTLYVWKARFADGIGVAPVRVGPEVEDVELVLRDIDAEVRLVHRSPCPVLRGPLTGPKQLFRMASKIPAAPRPLDGVTAAKRIPLCRARRPHVPPN